jgi:hypothetical protein
MAQIRCIHATLFDVHICIQTVQMQTGVGVRFVYMC